MRWPANIAKLSFGGKLPQSDSWSMNIYVDYPEDSDPANGDIETNGTRILVTEALVNWFQRTDSLISSSAFLGWIKLNSIGTDGKYRHSYTNEWAVQQYESTAGADGVVGVVGQPQWPHLTLAVTHRAAESRGPATRGRTYPPMVVISPNNRGVAAPEQLLAYANSYARMLSDIREAIPGETAGTPLIVSNGTKAAPEVGTRRPITRIEVGSVIDIQQRRRNALPEEYIAATTSPLGSAGTGVQPIGPGGAV